MPRFNTTPQHLSEILAAPFVEVAITKSELVEYGFSLPYPMKPHSVGMTFLDFAHAVAFLTTGGDRLTFVEGNRDKWNEMVRMLLTGRHTDAYKLFETFTKEDNIVIDTPWMLTGNSNPKVQALCKSHGSRFVESLEDMLRGSIDSSLGYADLTSPRTRARYLVHYENKYDSNTVRLDTMHTDVWLDDCQQGIRFLPSTEWLDLSDEPMGECAWGIYSNLSFTTRRLNLEARHMRSDYTLAQNMTYNLALDMTSHRFKELSDWHLYKDSFFSRIRSNVPLASMLGTQLVRRGSDQCPAILLHDTPGSAYECFKMHSGYGDQIRWQGIHAAPSSAVKKSGADANLSMLGRKTQSSSKKRELGFKLYDKETAEGLAGALEVAPGVTDSHDALTTYLDWYQDLRETARKMIRTREGASPEWGRWGFKPFDIAEYAANARLFIKIVEG